MYKARPSSATVAQLAGVAVILCLAGCAANQTTHTGYLSDYTGLVPGSDSSTAVYVMPGLKPGDFTQLSVDMVAIAGSSPRVAGLSEVERIVLQAHLMQSLLRVMEPTASASTAPAASPSGAAQTSAPSRQARVRAAITDFDAPNVAMNVVMTVVLVPLSTGGASVEFEVRDMWEALIWVQLSPGERHNLGRAFRFSGTQHDRPLRLFRRGLGRWIGAVHETVDLDGEVGDLRHALTHRTIPDMTTFLAKIERYTTLEAHKLASDGVRPRLGDLTARPIWTFAKLYLGKQGFRDGLEGLMFCALSGVSAAVRSWKLREIARAGGST